MECHCLACCSAQTMVSMAAADTLLAWTDPLTCSDPELPNSVAREPSCGLGRNPTLCFPERAVPHPLQADCGWKWGLKRSQEEEAGRPCPPRTRTK